MKLFVCYFLRILFSMEAVESDESDGDSTVSSNSKRSSSSRMERS
jgi:hypothetical protein